MDAFHQIPTCGLGTKAATAENERMRKSSEPDFEQIVTPNFGDPEPWPTIPGEQKLPIDEGPSQADWMAEVLEKWWLLKAEEEVRRTIPKAVEYGAADLEIMATAMLHLVPKDLRNRQLGLEMALAFYALGKVARLFGSYEQGQPASSDTWFDLGVYCRMAQRVREYGQWLPKEEK